MMRYTATVYVDDAIQLIGERGGGGLQECRPTHLPSSCLCPFAAVPRNQAGGTLFFEMGGQGRAGRAEDRSINVVTSRISGMQT